MTAVEPLPVAAEDAVNAVAQELTGALEGLEAVTRDLSAPPWDRDPVLWAAHEMARCAQALVTARLEDSELGAVLDYSRSAMACLTYAVRVSADARRGGAT